MHNLRINSSAHPKIIIKSSDVCLGSTRQHAQVGHKNINSFSYKNPLVRICIKGKQFILKDLQNNFVQFLAQELVTTYPKIGYRGFIDFEILQI
jgi:hypothetical protein